MKRSGEQIREHRESQGLTLAELGEKAGVSRQDIWAIENAKKPFGIKKLLKLSAALGVPFEPILTALLNEQLEREGILTHRVSIRKR